MRKIWIVLLLTIVLFSFCGCKVECDKCKGTGIILCEKCDGTGEYQCSDCNGAGLIKVGECDYCDGDGKIITTIPPSIDAKHSTTPWGSESIFYDADCYKCGGSGYIKEECKTCNGSGIIECEKCKGEGLVTCDKCNGEGKVDN